MKLVSLERSLFALAVSFGVFAATARGQENADGLTFRQIFFSELLDGQLRYPFAASVSPDGDDVYVSALESPSVAQFRRNADGTLEFAASTLLLPMTRGAALTPFDLTSAPNGRHVYVGANGFTTEGALFEGIVRLDRDSQTGELIPGARLPADDEAIEGIHRPVYVAHSPDGRHLYVLNGLYTQSPFYGPGIGVVSTDPSTGAMAVVQKIDFFSQLPMGFSTISDVTVSPDGQNVYVTRALDEGVEAYTRNPSTGELAFLNAVYLRASPRGFVVSVVVSPDGKHVYASEGLGGVIAILDREPDGSLTLLAGNTVALAGANRLVMAPDGEHVYATSGGGGGVVRVNAFARDPDTGALTLLESIADGVSGSFVLEGAALGAMDPEGEDLYLPASITESLAVFSVERPELPCEDFPMIAQEYEALAKAYSLYEDVDFDGLPESASLALIEEAGCANADDGFDEAITNAYLVNLAGTGSELEVYETGEWTPYQRSLAALRMISEAMGIYLNNAFGPFDAAMHEFYVAVTCIEGDCEPADARGAALRSAAEPFSGEGDPDEDGFTNAEEWANVLARGGDEREFAVSALDASNDGSTVVTFDGENSSGSCFIATAAYGTPMAEELNTLRGFRDSRLLTNPAGASFTDMYYRMSPPLAGFIADHPRVRAAARAVIAPITRWVK